MMNDKQKCELCSKTYSSKKNLYQHMRRVHNVEPNMIGKILCPVNVCDIKVATFDKLRNHLEVYHSLKIEKKEILTFPDEQEFIIWKEEEEKRDKSSFVVTTTKTLKNGSKKSYYSCNRSGVYTSQSTGARVPKAHGTCKIGSHCPATLEVIEEKEIKVKYFKTHVGHEKDLRHRFLFNLPATIQARQERDILQEIESTAIENSCTASSETSDNKILKTKINLILSLLDSHKVSEETSKKIHRNVDTIISLIHAEAKEPNKQHDMEPPNKKIQLQSRFYSNKKKRNTKAPISKPSTSYKLNLVDYVVKSESSFADHTYSNSDME